MMMMMMIFSVGNPYQPSISTVTGKVSMPGDIQEFQAKYISDTPTPLKKKMKKTFLLATRSYPSNCICMKFRAKPPKFSRHVRRHPGGEELNYQSSHPFGNLKLWFQWWLDGWLVHWLVEISIRLENVGHHNMEIQFSDKSHLVNVNMVRLPRAEPYQSTSAWLHWCSCYGSTCTWAFTDGNALKYMCCILTS